MSNQALQPAFEKTTDMRGLMAFRLGNQAYVLPIEVIVQIVPMVSVTHLPQVHPSVLGLISVRGEMVPVIDLRRYLGLEARLRMYTPIILTQFQERVMGLVVDEVTDVLSVRAEQISPVQGLLPEQLGEVRMLQGLVHLDEHMLPVFDLSQLFQPDQVHQLDLAVEALKATSAAGPQPGQKPGQKPMEENAQVSA